MPKKPKRKVKAPARTTQLPAIPAAPLTEAQAFIAMIERAAKDPAIDVAKLKELLAIKNSEQDRVASAAYASAMTQCQEEMEPVRRDCVNTQTRSRYASYEAL